MVVNLNHLRSRAMQFGRRIALDPTCAWYTWHFSTMDARAGEPQPRRRRLDDGADDVARLRAELDAAAQTTERPTRELR